MIINKSSPLRTPGSKDCQIRRYKPAGPRKIFRGSHSLSTPQMPKVELESLHKSRNSSSSKFSKQVNKTPTTTSKSFCIKIAAFEKVNLDKKVKSKGSTKLSKSSNPIFNDLSKNSIDYTRNLSKIEIACITRTGTIEGKPKPVNQDSLVALKNLAGRSNYSLAAVFDGHGPEGHHVSRFIELNYSEILKSKLKSCSEPINYDQLFKDVVSETHTRLISSSMDTTYSGSTLISLFLNNDEFTCASVGDSRAIMCSHDGNWFFRQLNKEHKPHDPEEKARIEDSGGRVGCMKDANGRPVGPVRAWGPGPDSPGLAMSRTMGDKFAKEFGVTATPDIITGALSPNDRAFIVASDGLWDVVKNQQVIDVVSKFWENGEVNSAAVALQSIAVKNAMKHGGYVDDISIVVVFRQ